MPTTADAKTSKKPNSKRVSSHLPVGLGVSGIGGMFWLTGKHVPWWAVLLWSMLALVVIAIRSVIPQESEDRVDVIQMFLGWLETRSARSVATRKARKRRRGSRSGSTAIESCGRARARSARASDRN